MTPDLKSAALVVVDMQNDFCHPNGALAQRGVDVSRMPAVASCNRDLLQVFHREDAPVFLVRTEHSKWTNSPVWRSRVKSEAHSVDALPVCQEGTWGAQYFGIELSDVDREIVKRRYTAFYGTDLETSLRALSITQLVITGVATNVCVESTVRDAFVRDFDVFVVPEACDAITTQEHDAGLDNIRTYFGHVLLVDELIRKLTLLAEAGGRV